ncbi:recombinase family protein [Fimbriiglobus ruber]|uniref:Transposase n=1 Tax=Fimbriiglobus ruber TaxID=1908690 RepID=A0A225DPE8_9BACT|nr:recombinase family protein [Fimbriiglobus ruber]OWK39356.1 Transposase [Fimbriiglobus ruber]
MNPSDPTIPFGHKIRPRHRDRLAVVSIRQSTSHQVVSNRESADLQYQLRQRAVTLGWADERVLVIDDDQGISGTSVDNRPGFQRLLAEVSLEHVGIVFGREMSRRSRSCRDWHPLLELCALFQVLIADADGVYDPTEPSDRLLLGLRGMMSEAELHVLKARMHQGKLNKARRGELFTCVPIGYVRSPDDGIARDPDEQVRSVVSLVFATFAELGSLTKTHAYFVANNIPLGLRVYQGPGKGRLVGQRPRRSTLYGMLRHPISAGAYAFGRCPFDPQRRIAGKPKSGRRVAPPEDWVCWLKDKVPADISWEQYEENGRRLTANDRGPGSKKATGRAPTRLNGIVRCGRCGQPMAARSARASANPRYACDREFQEYGGARCQSVVAGDPDRLVESLVLRAVEPASRELSFRAAERLEEDRERLHTHWKQRVERAGYEADRARRPYEAVDPANRLVARERERQWEQKLAEHQRLTEDYARFQVEQPRHLNDSDRGRIVAVAADLPGLWRSPTTTGGDRRAIVRLLIEGVELARHGESERVDVAIHWRGGTTTRHEVRQGLRKDTSVERYAELRQRVVTLRGEGLTADQIAGVLNDEGYRVARGETFTGHRVRQLWARFGRSGVPAGVRDASDLPGSDEYWLPTLADRLGVKPIVVHRWRWSGWLHARQLRGENGRWIVWASATEIRRLRRLRAFERKHHGRRTPPVELTKPALRTQSDHPTTHSQSGGK